MAVILTPLHALGQESEADRAGKEVLMEVLQELENFTLTPTQITNSPTPSAKTARSRKKKQKTFAPVTAGTQILVHHKAQRLWRPAIITKIEDNRYTVEHLDADTPVSTVDRSEFRIEHLKPGMLINIYDTDDRLLDAVILKRSQHLFVVAVEGEKVEISLADIVIRDKHAEKSEE
jgi:hypothetical protein